MVIKRDLLYKILLATLFIAPPLIFSIEVNIVLLSLVAVIVLFNLRHKYSVELIKIVIPLIIVFLIALFSSIFYSNKIFDFIKDFFFLLKPILYVIIGYFFIKRIKNKAFLFELIVYSALFFAVIHIYLTVYYLSNFEFDVNLLRDYAGRGNALEVFALAIIFSKKGKELFRFNPKYKKLIIFIFVLSFIGYLSRTVTVSVIILILSLNGYLAITRKGVLYMFGFFISVGLFYVYLFSVDLERGAPGIEGFLYKLKIAPQEIFASEIDVNDHADLWDHWRAYEAKRAYEQLEDTWLGSGLVFGKGFGSLVDLGFEAPLGGTRMQYISTLHNGYSFILYKSGVLGILCYLVFLILLYRYVYSMKKNEKSILVNNFLSGTAIYYMFTTLIVTGLYNPRDFGGLIIGGLLSLKFYYEHEPKTESVPKLED